MKTTNNPQTFYIKSGWVGIVQPTCLIIRKWNAG